MKYKSLIIILILFSASLSAVLWLDNEMAKGERVLGEKIIQESQESKSQKVYLASPYEDGVQSQKSDDEIQVQKFDDNLDMEQEKENEELSLPTTQNIEKNLENKLAWPVVKVVDGDTIDVKIDGKIERLRLIGINTPETVDPRKPVECFGKEASNKAKELLANKNVYLEADETQGNRDKYNRLLRYVYREDGLFYNLEIIKQGYAYEYTYKLPYKFQTDFKNAENHARNNKLGLWNENVCK